MAQLAKVDKQKENEELFDVAGDLPVDVPEVPPVAPTVPVTQLLNMVRDASVAYKILTAKNLGERKDALMKISSTLTAVARDTVLACSARKEGRCFCYKKNHHHMRMVARERLIVNHFQMF